MRVISGSNPCKYGECPQVMDDGTDDLLVQGYASDVTAPSGEAVVRVPKAVLLAAADTLRAEAASR